MLCSRPASLWALGTLPCVCYTLTCNMHGHQSNVLLSWIVLLDGPTCLAAPWGGPWVLPWAFLGAWPALRRLTSTPGRPSGVAEGFPGGRSLVCPVLAGPRVALVVMGMMGFCMWLLVRFGAPAMLDV